jgi:hypothetical protein
MAATVSITGTPGLTLVDDATGTTGWSGASGGTDTEVKVQSTGSYTYQTGKSTRAECTFTPASSIDMSATDTHLYWWMQCAVFPFCELKSTGTTTASGLTVRIESSATDFEEWHIAGKDTWGGEWKCFCIDINHSGTERYATGGTISRSAITKITWYTDNSNSGNIRIIDNTWIDVVRFGTGLTAYGTDFDYADIEAIDQNSSNMYGIIQEDEGVYFVQGGIKIVDNASTTTFTSVNETLAFLDNTISAGLYKLSFSETGTTIDISGWLVLSSGINANTRYDIDTQAEELTDLAGCDIIGCSFSRGGTMKFRDAQNIKNSVFTDCLEITTQVSPEPTAYFQDNTISNYTGSSGALIYGGGTDIKNLVFINNDVGIYTTTSSDFTMDNFVFDDVSGKYDIWSVVNAITVTKTNGSNPNSYDPAGEIVTFTAAFNHIITGMVENTEVTYVKQSDSSVLFHVEDVTATGTTTYVHAGGDLVDIMIFHVDKLPEVSNVYDLTLPNGNASIQVAQYPDPNYLNP